MSKPLSIRFWGVRGTLPATSPEMSHYGGNTSCVEVRVGDRRLILDAGSGLAKLGKTLTPGTYDLMLSHTHVDHILGFPFCEPLYDPDFHFRFWAGNLLPERTLKQALEQMMSPPLFPVTLKSFRAKVELHDFTAGANLDEACFTDDDIYIETHVLNHPGRATGYRISHGGRSVCYITDIEHTPGELDRKLLEFIHESDCLIYDGTFDDSEMEKHRGWGHSSWQQAARLASEAKIGKLAVFHHHPDATDEVLKTRESQINALCDSAIFAQEGLVLSLD